MMVKSNQDTRYCIFKITGNIWCFFQVKYRDVKKLSAVLLGLFLFLCTSTIIASIFFGLASSKTIESEVKIKTIVEGNTFWLKKGWDK